MYCLYILGIYCQCIKGVCICCVCVLYYNVQLLVQVNKVFVLFCFVKPNLKALTINVETTVVYTQEYPIALSMVGIGQLSKLTAGCLPISHVLEHMQHLFYNS